METTTGEISQIANSTTEGTPQIKTKSLVKEITINKLTPFMLRLQTIKAIINSHSFKSPKSDEPRRVQVLDLYYLTRLESEGSSKGIVY